MCSSDLVLALRAAPIPIACIVSIVTKSAINFRVVFLIVTFFVSNNFKRIIFAKLTIISFSVRTKSRDFPCPYVMYEVKML